MRYARKLLLVFVVTVVAVCGLSWWLGRQVEATFDRQFEQLSQSPYVASVSREYVRGFFSARETLILTLSQEWQERLLLLAANANLPLVFLREPVQLRNETRIRIGPLAGGLLPAAGRARSEMFVEGALGKEISAALDGVPMLTATVRFGFGGGATGTLEGPAFSYVHPEGATEGLTALSWGGFHGTFSFSRDFRRVGSRLRMPSAEFQTHEGRLQLSGLTVDSKQYQPFQDIPLFYAGAMNLTLERMAFFSPEEAGQNPALLTLHGLAWKTDLPRQDEYFDLDSRLSIEELHVAGDDYGPVHYYLVLHRLHGHTLARLYQVMIDEYYGAPVTGPADPSGFLEEFTSMELLVEMLRHSPELHRYEIGFNSAYGPASMFVRAGFEDLKPEDLDLPFVALVKLVAGGELSLPVEMLRHAVLAWDTDSEAMFDLQLHELQKQGYVDLNDQLLKVRFGLKRLEVTVNDKPLNLFGSGVM